MIATMKQPHQYVDTLQGIDPRMIVPLCIRENQLEGDMLPPGSPTSEGASKGSTHPLADTRLLSSPTSIAKFVENTPLIGGKGDSTGFKDKPAKTKKKKGKLFRSRRKGAKDEIDPSEIAKQKEALRQQQIQEEEDADFAKLRSEEEASPKLDMLVHYPATLMEDVLSMPATEPDTEDSNAEESNEAMREQHSPVDDPVGKKLDLGRFEKDVVALRMSQMELRKFVSQRSKFTRLQQELRSRRAITDETLKQQLHILCRDEMEEEDDEIAKGHDIFSEPADRGPVGFTCKLAIAYKRMNAVPAVVKWREWLENNPTINEPTRSRKKRSDRKLLLNRVQLGKETETQEEGEEGENLLDGVDLLSFCVNDLVPIVEEDEVFVNLQRELRKNCAITNEVLKQGLHFYVRDVKVQKEREEAATRSFEEEKHSTEHESQSSLEDSHGAAKRRPFLKKLRFRSKRDIS